MATTIEEVPKLEENPRGIPRAPFVQDVEKHLGSPDAEVESSIRAFQEAISKYKYMENNLLQRKKGLEEKIPDIKKTLVMVQLLQDRKNADITEPMTGTFELNDTLWAEAVVDNTDEVYLWLGANVMLSYPVSDALTLLQTKLKGAQTNLKGIVDDLEFIREQVTVMEVNTARVYNYDVRRRRQKGLTKS
ncbi:hypothetical protein FRC14_002464 [Serendipita sp. 396]|nr:hypothetical protein FRC14_002464 [Serendipita sp. 396]KAG8788680.1 hypothetical protein FRC15_002837 [Serendipita sp. 397]KAG8803787.1 hypothetical protein FRC16_002993 [Serendipita sp. 398]KAG8827388.1 hypothetical protein FRC19_003537 [Serendipita sp. 401]KAG8860438.1 hypothetical protein FRB91_003133 [Serendipita sp. 411]KAG9057887.1 hypothetical protein FS842_003207 [Serendipita sp. 407]